MPGESTNIDSLNIKIETSSSKAKQALEDTATSLDKVRDAAPGAVDGLKKTAESAKNTTKQFQGTTAEIGKLARQAAQMGDTLASKQMKEFQKLFSRHNDIAKYTDDVKSLSAALYGVGKSGEADTFESVFLDPHALEEQLRAQKAAAEEAERIAKEAKKQQEADAKAARKQKEAEDWSARRKEIEDLRHSNKMKEQEDRAANKRSLEIQKFANKQALADYRDQLRRKLDAERSAQREEEEQQRAFLEKFPVFTGSASDVGQLASMFRDAGLGDAAKQLEKIKVTAADGSGDISNLAVNVQNLINQFEAMGNTDAANQLKKFVDPLKAQAAAMKEVEKSSKSAAKGQRSLGKETKGLKGAFEKATKPIRSFVASVKRIIMYRMIRTVIKEIGQAIREGLSNLNEYSKAVGTDFAKAVESLKKHANLLKNAFATALRPVIEALIPVIEQLCVWLANAADFLAQVFSIITGKVDDRGRYTKAVLGDLEESTEQAKELKRTLLGFDEINRLDGDNGGGSGTSVGTQFVQEEISPEAQETAKRLQAIIERIKNFINDTDWEAVTGFLGLAMTVLGFATGSIPTIIAGAVLLTSNIDAVSRALEKAKKKVSQLAEKIKKTTDSGDTDFNNFKNSVIDATATIVNSTLDIVGIISSQIADTVNTAWSIIKKLLSGDLPGALNEFVAYLGRTWERIKALVSSLGDIVVALVNGIILKALEFGVEWVRKKITGLLDNIIKKLHDSKTLAGHQIANLLTIVRDFVNNALTAIGTIINFVKTTVSTIVNIVKLMLNGDFKGALAEFVVWLISLAETILNILIAAANVVISILLNLVINPIMHAIEWLWNKVLVPVINKIAQAVYDVARSVTQVMEDIANGIQDGLKWVWNNVILKFLNTLMGGVVDKINGIIEWSNRVLGTEIKPIDLQVIPDWEPEKYDFALPEQEVKIVGEWEFKDFEFQIPQVDWTEFKEKARSAIKVVEDEVVSLTTLMKRTIKEAQETHIGTRTITAYANGGYPTAGSMFIAGEAGPEYVGSFGGQTGVLNTDQMATALYNAMSAALANMPQQGGDIYLDGQVIYRNVVKRNNNYVRSTGRTALLT